VIVVIDVIFVFFLLVVAHEFGHFIVAKWARMRVDRFQVGFGPAFLRLGRWGETEFSVGPLPFGGFVAIHGMIPGDYAPEERAFQDAPLGKRMITIAAGPAMSLLLGYLLFIYVGAVYGIVDIVEPPQIGPVVEGRVADKAGVREGDRVLSIDGAATTSWEQVADKIHESVGKTLTFVLERDGERLSVQVVPQADQIIDFSRPLRPTKITVGRIFCMPATHRVRVGAGESVLAATSHFDATVKALLGTLFSPLIKDSIRGPVAIVSFASEVSKQGFAEVLELAGMLSLSLGIINLFPLPVLDGGYMMLFTIEWLRRGKKMSAKTQIGIQAAGFIILVILFALITSMDIQRLLKGQGP
jgi:regulator of sigma E protease